MIKLILFVLSLQTVQADSLEDRQRLGAARERAKDIARCTAGWQETMSRETSTLQAFVRAHRGQRLEGSCEVWMMDPNTQYGGFCSVDKKGVVAFSGLDPSWAARIWSCRLYLNDGLDCQATAIDGLSARCWDVSGNQTNFPRESQPSKRTRKAR